MLLVTAVAVLAGAASTAQARTVTATKYSSSARHLAAGAMLSWEVGSQCEKGPKACDRVLREVNERLRWRGLHIWEDGSASLLRKNTRWSTRVMAKGANTAQGVWSRCIDGPAACDEALRKANRTHRQVIFFEDGSAALRR